MEKTALSKDEYRNKAARYCAAAEHCESEIREKLRQWGCPSDFPDEIVDYLLEHDYINPSRYCRAYAHDKLHYNGWGKLKIQMMLRARRLPSADIEAALQAIDEEEYKAIRQRVMRKKKGATPVEMARFLQQRGFATSEWPTE